MRSRPRLEPRLLVLGPAVLCLTACGETTPTAGEVPSSSTTQVELLRSRFEPVAIGLGEGTTTLRLEVRGARADSLRARVIASSPDYQLLLHGTPLDPQGRTAITLYDDGTRGDERAGDGIYATDGLSVRDGLPAHLSGGLQVYRFYVTTLIPFPAEGATWRLAPDASFAAWLYGVPPDFEAPPVRSPAPGVRVTDHAVHLTLPAERLTDEGGDLRQVERYFDPRTVANEYYRWFEDDRDFLVVTQPFPLSFESPQPRYHQIRNESLGTGERLFDNSDGYGSDGRLLGEVLYYAGLPRPSETQTLIHELNHHWSGRFDPALGINGRAGHWGLLLDRDYDGFESPRYNDFELYLMGALPADSVLPRRIGRNGLSLDDLIGLAGSREPAFPDAPRAFTAAFIHVDDHPLDDLALGVFDYIAREFGGSTATGSFFPFEVATGGRATLDTRIPAPASASGGP